MAELGCIGKVSHLRIFMRRIKMRKFMILCCGHIGREKENFYF